MEKFYDCVDKGCFECDPYNAPYMRIKAKSPSKAKAIYHKNFPEYNYIDILVRTSKQGSYD